MPWNALLFPLVAGYFILNHCFLFKFSQQRLDNQRLIFECIIVSLYLGVIAFSLRCLFNFLTPNWYNVLNESMPIRYPLLGTSALTLILAGLFTFTCNLFVKKDYGLRKAIETVGNEFELIAYDSVYKSALVQISMSNEKVYVGWIKELPIPSISKYYRIIPAFSGYRDDMRNVHYTTHYLKVYSEIIAEGKATSVMSMGTDVVLDISKINTISYFDLDLHERFNKSISIKTT